MAPATDSGAGAGAWVGEGVAERGEVDWADVDNGKVTEVARRKWKIFIDIEDLKGDMRAEACTPKGGD
jgi:hypothetical protein